MQLGENIRARRLRRGLTLDALADRCGVSRAMLSEVERDSKSPTIRVLCEIASGLQCTVSELIEEGPKQRLQVVRADERPTVRDPESGVERQLLSTVLTHQGLEAVAYVLPPGTSAGPFDPMMLGQSEHITVTQGRLCLVHDGHEERLDAGDSITYGAAEKVIFRNAGRGVCRLFLVLDKSHLSLGRDQHERGAGT